MSTEFAIRWIAEAASAVNRRFRTQPCEIKVSRGTRDNVAYSSTVNIYLILPISPERKRQAYQRVMAVDFQFVASWLSSERAVRAALPLIPVRLGVDITHINWWGYKRREVWDGEATAA